MCMTRVNLSNNIFERGEIGKLTKKRERERDQD